LSVAIYQNDVRCELPSTDLQVWDTDSIAWYPYRKSLDTYQEKKSKHHLVIPTEQQRVGHSTNQAGAQRAVQSQTAARREADNKMES